MNNKFIIENCVKEGGVILLLCLCYSPISSFIATLPSDGIIYQTIILFASLLIMAFLFANFTFTYKDTLFDRTGLRFLDHLNTVIMIFGCGLLLEITHATIQTYVHAPFVIATLPTILFFISLILFDFWDLIRGLREKNAMTK